MLRPIVQGAEFHRIYSKDWSGQRFDDGGRTLRQGKIWVANALLLARAGFRAPRQEDFAARVVAPLGYLLKFKGEAA